MNLKLINDEELLDLLVKESKNKFGLICLNYLLEKATLEELKNYMQNNNISIKGNINVKTDYITTIIQQLYNQYKVNSELKRTYDNVLEYIGISLFQNEPFKNHLLEYDFISKQELSEVFADYCADLGISVYKGLKEYNLDLYLIRRTPLLRTESVIVRTGTELTEENYQGSLKILQNSSKISTWLIFVTTPHGIFKIGLKRMIKDMQQYNIWLYVIDPIHVRIHGITKGKKSKDYEETLRDIYVSKLQNSKRNPSKVINISKYAFSESDSYKSSKFLTYGLLKTEEFEKLKGPDNVPKYRHIFRSLIIIDKESGLDLFNHSNKEDSLEQSLISSFLTAMDNFVSELGSNESSLEDINYKGFYIQAAYGERLKVALFLSKHSDQILKERLSFFIKYMEENFKEQIDHFKLTGQVSVFDRKKLTELVIKFLKI
ncbi:MAG: hypothetical protein ACTSR8_03120 [Promethearchaeota archaeon]